MAWHGKGNGSPYAISYVLEWNGGRGLARAIVVFCCAVFHVAFVMLNISSLSVMFICVRIDEEKRNVVILLTFSLGDCRSGS